MVVSREWALNVIQQLPEQCTLPEIMEALEVQHRVLVGRQQILAGMGIPHEQAEKRLRQQLDLSRFS